MAKSDNSVGWFETADHYENGINVSEEDAADFLNRIDCYVMGSRTYEHALELFKTYGWVYGDTATIVLTQQQLPVDRTNVELYHGDLIALVNDRLKPRYQNVWVAGGAELSKAVIRLNLADEIRQSILPIILGDGIPFLDQKG